MVLGHWEGAGLATGHKSIAGLSGRTAADGQMGLGLATGARGALSDAGIDALVVDAGPVIGALVVAQTFTLKVRKQRFHIRCINNIDGFYRDWNS